MPLDSRILVCACALILATPLHAQESKAGSPWLGPPDPALEVSLASRGISKGLSQTDGPQLVVRGELAFRSLVASAYGKNVSSSTADGEAGVSLGFRRRIGSIDAAANATWKRAIDAAVGADANSLEFAGSISRKWGPLTPKLSAAWSPDQLGSTRRSLFVEASTGYKLGKAVLTAAIARRERSGGLDYTAWNAGLSYSLAGPLLVDLRVHDTNRSGDQAYRRRLVASARARF